jgi:hypothetical protein
MKDDRAPEWLPISPSREVSFRGVRNESETIGFRWPLTV